MNTATKKFLFDTDFAAEGKPARTRAARPEAAKESAGKPAAKPEPVTAFVGATLIDGTGAAPVVAEIVSPWKAMHDENWQDRGMFTPVQDPVYGSVICAQAQWKANHAEGSQRLIATLRGTGFLERA